MVCGFNMTKCEKRQAEAFLEYCLLYKTKSKGIVFHHLSAIKKHYWAE